MIIYTALNRQNKFLAKKELCWGELVESLKKPIITSETQEEYFKMPKAKQDDIKDVGGFVAGELLNRQRKATNVLNRCILTLDADYANSDFCDYIDLLHDFTYCIYSTHKHTKEQPRYRLLIPLNRVCNSEEYEAVARMVASDIGIDLFDDTTYQAHRLMYYPSVSKDGEYIFKHKEKKNLNVDEILSRYKNWKNREEWVTSKRTDKRISTTIKKQQDPRTKKGMIGAFCRIYDIHSVIEKYLYDVYIPCGDLNRYTYSKGSTYGGMIVYDNGLFSYSNHATDPSNGRLCNSFDLLRIHKFGYLGEKQSFKAVLEFLKIDSEVNKEIIKERLAEAKDEFRNIDKEKLDWIDELAYNKKGAILQSIFNCEKILMNDEKLKNKIALDIFTKKVWVLGSLPWNENKEKRQWADVDDSGLRLYLERTYGVTQRNHIFDAWNLVINYNSFNPVENYLKSLKWDGIKRLDTLFIDYLGVKDNIYTREATRKSLVGAVARIYEAGTKLDTSIVLVGSQGVGKSQIVRKLGKEWFSDSLTTVKGKEAYEQIQGFWIIEIAELSAMKKVEIEAVKHFMSKREDSFRGAYARNVETHKRQCIFICTTNTYDCLRDVTGGRRFYPLDVDKDKSTKDIWTDLTEKEVDQIWAEAVYLYKAKESLILSPEAKEIAQLEQESHTEYNPLEGIINSYLEMPVPDNWYDKDLFERINYIRNENKVGKPRDRVCVLEIWCEALEGNRKELTQQKSREIADLILKTRNWEKVNPRRFGYLYGNQRAYKRICSPTFTTL